jgi:hypothetical protein
MVGFNSTIILHLILDMFTWLRNSLVELMRLMTDSLRSIMVEWFSSTVEPLRRTTVEWFALCRTDSFNGRIIASDDGRMRRGK